MSKRSAAAEKDESYTNANIPGFLSKTYEIFSTPEFEDICSWGPNGDTIIVKKIEEFSKSVLPKFFKHSNFQSFVRQLNMYDFHKTVQDPSHGEFQHKHFIKDRPDLLHLIKRKAHTRSAEAKRRTIDSAHELRNESGAIMNEMIQLRKMKEDIETRLSDMEYKQSQLIAENTMLKNTMEQSLQKQELMKQKMQRILYFMYEMYMNSNRGSGNAWRVEGPSGLNAITNIGENYAEAMRLLDMEPSALRITELAQHPAVEDLASTGSLTPRTGDNGITSTNQSHNSYPAPGGEAIRVASFDSGAASVVPPAVPFGRMLSIEAPPAPALAPASSEASTNSSSTNSQPPQAVEGSSLRRMYSVVPTDDAQQLKRPRTRAKAEESKAGPDDNLQADVSAWSQNQENLMTRIDSLDATLSQLLDAEDLDSLPSFDETYLKAAGSSV